MKMMLWFVALALLGLAAGQKKKMILVVDGSVEDGKAVLLALEHPDTEILGIVCAASFLSAQQCARNLDRIRRLADHPEVPIFLGSPSSLVATKRANFAVDMGTDGFGEVSNHSPAEKATPAVEETSGALALTRIARKHKDSGVVVVVTAPLTDVALATRLDPEFGSNIKALYVLGGNMFGVGMAGSPAAEYNFFADPEAAYVVLNHMTAPIIMIPHETIHQRDNSDMYDLFSSPIRKDAFLSANSTKAKFLREISLYYLSQVKKTNREYTFGDEIAVAAAIRPSSVIDRIKPIAATIELFGEHTRGQVAIDWLNKDLRNINVRVVTEYSPRAVSSMMIKAVADNKDEDFEKSFF